MKKFFSLMVFLLLVGIILSSSCRPPELEGVVINMNQGLYDKAYELAQEAVEKYPDNPEAWYLLGDLHARNEKFQEMNEAFAKSLSLSEKFKPDIEQIRMQYFAENYNNALKNYYNKARGTEDPKEKRELFCQAADKFLNSYQAMPSRAEPLTPMSVSYLECGDTATAEKYIMKSIEFNPQNDTMMVTVGDFYYKINKTDMAIDMYQRAIAINSNNTEAHLALGEIYANQESLEKAIEEFKVAMDQNPDNSAIPMNISILLYNNKKYQEAVPYIQKTLEMEGANKDMYELLSLSYMQMAQKHLDEFQETEDEESAKKAIQIYEEALPTLEKAVQEFPDSALLWNNLGVCYAQTGNKDKAEEAFEKQQQLEESE